MGRKDKQQTLQPEKSKVKAGSKSKITFAPDLQLVNALQGIIQEVQNDNKNEEKRCKQLIFPLTSKLL